MQPPPLRNWASEPTDPAGNALRVLLTKQALNLQALNLHCLAGKNRDDDVFVKQQSD